MQGYQIGDDKEKTLLKGGAQKSVVKKGSSQVGNLAL